MRVLFCHDGPLRKDELGNYYGSAHNDDTFQRYYSIANELAIAIRVDNILKIEAELKYSKITVKPFEVVQCLNISSLKGILLNRKKTKDIIENEVLKSDYIIARLPSTIGFLAIDFAKKANKPYLIELVTCPWDAFWNHSIKGKAIAPYMYFKTRKYIKEAKYVVYVTNRFLQNRYPTAGQSTNCSNVALVEFDDAILEKRLSKIEGMKNSNKIVLGTTAAVNVRFKGQHYVIQALGKLKKQGITHFEYQLVGGGNQKYLKKVAEQHGVTEQVKFLGAIPHNEIYKWLDGIDLYVQPSRQEGLPRALIEAMSRGIPAFGARTAGIPELIEDEYIFSNTKKNIREICNILTSLSGDNLKLQSTRNFEEAKKYDKGIINNKRMNFFETFKSTSI